MNKPSDTDRPSVVATLTADQAAAIAQACDRPAAAAAELVKLKLVACKANGSGGPALWGAVWAKADSNGELRAEAPSYRNCPDGLCRPEAAVLLLMGETDPNEVPVGVALSDVTVQGHPATLATRADMEAAIERVIDRAVHSIPGVARQTMPKIKATMFPTPGRIQRRVAAMSARQIRTSEGVASDAELRAAGQRAVRRAAEQIEADDDSEAVPKGQPPSQVWLRAAYDAIAQGAHAAHYDGLGL